LGRAEHWNHGCPSADPQACRRGAATRRSAQKFLRDAGGRVTVQLHAARTSALAETLLVIMTQPTLSRRSFLKASAVVAAGLSARSWGRVVGANSDIRVAVVGLNNHGRVHLKRFREVEGVRIAAICDC